jgi:DNA helicase IV
MREGSAEWRAMIEARLSKRKKRNIYASWDYEVELWKEEQIRNYGVRRQEAKYRAKERQQEEERRERARRREEERLRILAEHEERERRLEKQRQELARREAEKQSLLKRLKEYFEQDFLNAYNFYQVQCSEHISPDEYQAEKLNHVRSWIQRRLNPEKPPDLEQAAAIGAVEGHVQVVARAGSGKTSTLVNRALFLQQHCGIAPSEMLLLAFNRKAAEEIRERLAARLQESIPHVMTFHALAYLDFIHSKLESFSAAPGLQTGSQTFTDVRRLTDIKKSLEKIWHPTTIAC